MGVSSALLWSGKGFSPVRGEGEGFGAMEAGGVCFVF